MVTESVAHLIPPAQLWIGPTQEVANNLIAWLQEQLCSSACKQCITCKHIEQKQHHALLWINLEKNYTVELLEPVFRTTSFTLSDKERYFIVLPAADTLSTVCANSLLKIIEEPPAGYHFILLAQRQEHVLETIQSRCIIKKYNSDTTTLQTSDLFQYFTNETIADHTTLLTILEKHALNEQETISLVNGILEFWLAHYKTAIMNNNIRQIKKITYTIEVLQQAIKLPPMPGGSKLFWKNLLLQLQKSIQTGIL